jgi:heme/copper-type cytochrome/quinol oxidase subunit 1
MRFKIQSFLRPDILLYLIVLGLIFLVIKVRGLVADIQLHDTYYVVEYSYFIYPFIILFAIEGLIYSAFIFLKKHPNYILSLIYFIVSIVSVISLITAMQPLIGLHSFTRRYYLLRNPSIQVLRMYRFF